MTDTSTNAGTEPQPRKSLEEIAAMMAENTMRMRGMQPNEVTTDDDTSTDEQITEDENAVEEATEESRGEETVSASDDKPAGGDDKELQSADTDDTGEDTVEAADDFDMEIDDETMFALDDETEVSFKDLRDLYQSDKVTVELVEQTRAATQEALAERQRAVEDSQKAREAAMAVFQHFENIISMPLFRAPDESLKTTNPEMYIQQLEAFQQDQQRIADQKRDLGTVFDEHVKQAKEVKENLKKEEMKLLFQKVPALVSQDEAKRTTANKDILDAAAFYGFSPEEVNEATDHRIYQMAHDAQQYRKIMSKTGGGATDTEEVRKTKVRNQTRTLRPRGTTAKTRLTAKAKRVKAAKATAKKTGKVQDVADFIAASKT